MAVNEAGWVESVLRYRITQDVKLVWFAIAINNETEMSKDVGVVGKVSFGYLDGSS